MRVSAFHTGRIARHLGPRLEPLDDTRRIGIALRVEIDLGIEPLVEPGRKGLAEALHHRADADVGGQREQQRHQGQRQARELLAAVGPEPLGERVVCASLPRAQQTREHERQQQRGSEQNARDDDEPGDETLALQIGHERHDEARRSEQSLPPELR